MGVLEGYNSGFKKLDLLVFPSEEKTIEVQNDDIYGGAHFYRYQMSEGFKDGNAVYTDALGYIQFVHKADDGTVTPGAQSEQLAFILLDRARKLNARFPSPQNEQMVKGLEMFLDACEARVKERMDRGVMGDLKK